MRSRLLAATLTLGLAATAGPHAQQRALDEFFERFTAEWIRSSPNLAVSTRYFSGIEQEAFDRRLSPLSADWRTERIELAGRGLAELRRFDRALMSDSQRVSADLLDWQLDTFVAGAPFQDYVYPLEQFAGANVNLVAELTLSHPLQTERDVSTYLARLASVPVRMSEAVAEAKRIATVGVVPPRFILVATIDQMRQFVAVPPSENPFVTTLAERTGDMKGLSAARRLEHLAEAERIVGSQIYPAWEAATRLLDDQLPASTDDPALSRFADGANAYAYQLRRFTTTNLSADEIHQIGLREVARIEQEMDRVLGSIGRRDGSVKDRIERLKKDLAYPATEAGRADIMRDIGGIIRDAERRSAVLFDRRPRASVVARPYPKFREGNAAASYSDPPMDGSRPALFQMPLRPGRMTKFGLRSLVYHETVPGHHFQIALGLEDSSLPRFRRIRAFGTISAVVEGWGLYAERLAAESGWYDSDPEGRLGQLDFELWRAKRLVVDTGLHTKGWTRQQAIDYGIEPSEVERYVVYPGQACSYMIGELKILELRDKARTALGDRFSLKAFHNAVLGAGAVPLQILEAEVNRYIRSATAR